MRGKKKKTLEMEEEEAKDTEGINRLETRINWVYNTIYPYRTRFGMASIEGEGRLSGDKSEICRVRSGVHNFQIFFFFFFF